MENIQREMDIDFFFILRVCSSRNGFLPAEMVKVLREMLHPFLDRQAEMENIQGEMNIYFFSS